MATDLVDRGDAEVVGLLFGAAIAQVAERLEAERGIPRPWSVAVAAGRCFRAVAENAEDPLAALDRLAEESSGAA